MNTYFNTNNIVQAIRIGLIFLVLPTAILIATYEIIPNDIPSDIE